MEFSRKNWDNPGYRSLGLGQSKLSYPNPFFDIAGTYYPKNIKQLFKYCELYYFTNPIINSVITKLTEYAVRPMELEVNDIALKKKYEHLFEEVLNFTHIQKEIGLNRNTYGNSFVAVKFPFKKQLQCQNCKGKFIAKDIRKHYKWRRNDFYLSCPRCGHSGDAKSEDLYVKSLDEVRIINYHPKDITIEYGHGLSDNKYYYEIPKKLKSDIKLGKKEIVEDTPKVFIEAVKKEKKVLFKNSAIFHMKRPAISHNSPGWGMPMILPVLKDAYYVQLLRKSQEALALDHLVPMRFIFPQSTNAMSDPMMGSVNMADWENRVKEEIEMWRMDPNHIPIVPLPISEGRIGGQGKVLDLSQEFELWNNIIINGMMVPIEFVKGGLSYSGSNVSMRMLENMILDQIADQTRLTNWVITRVSRFMSWPTIKAKAKKFKMADDLQRSMYLFQLNGANKISDKTLLEDINRDVAVEEELKVKETQRQIEAQKKSQLAMASIQGQASVIQAKHQAIAQQSMGAIGNFKNAPNAVPQASTEQQQAAVPAPPAIDMNQLAARAAASIVKMDPQQRGQAMQKLRMEQPQLFQVVLQNVINSQGTKTNQENPIQSEQPRVKAPRRDVQRAV